MFARHLATFIVLVTVGSSWTGIAAQSPDQVDRARAVDVYVLAGQSNAEGVGIRAELPRELSGPFDDVQVWNDFLRAGRWEPLEVGVNHLSTNDSKRAARVGMEMSLVRELQRSRPGRPIRLVKLAVDGAPLGRVPGAVSWDPDSDELYAAMVAKLRAAVGALRAESLEPTLRGFVWYQGETDATVRALATAYLERMRRFHARTVKVIDELGITGEGPLAFVTVAIHPQTFGARGDAMVEEVRAAQRALSSLVAGCSLVDTAELALQKDDTHLTTAALVELGAMIAAVLAPDSPPPPR